MVSWVSCAGRRIGPGAPCFIVAEAGVNHNGHLEDARDLVDAARRAGADAIKFQTWVTEKLMVPDARMAPYQVRNTRRRESQFTMAKRLELSYAEFRRLKGYAQRRGIIFFSTPDEEDSANFLDELGVPVFKIGSGEVTNLPFLRHVARKRRPIILSTGMSTMAEVEAAVQAIEAEGNRQLVLLHCVSEYPARPSDCNLRAMETLHSAFRYPVGFSDHTLGHDVAVAAVVLGACVIEKHLTLDQSLPGPDHQVSLDEQGFARLVGAIRVVESALGSGRKRPTPGELKTRAAVQKRVVAARNLSAGTRLASNDLMLRRASRGLPAESLAMLVGREVRRAIKGHEVIVREMLW
ncbi:MAG: N-acetylneuraminate synthase [Omnitrophica bacterium RIFCSPHIGHO2_02_FULL_63_14]|nr:MAG: N-acetylneuraminate synthase [Omnitrophica bacterium RIFCSPHIGHO2_02_FULL_63_14]